MSAQEPLIRHLSLVIRGWANYHRHVAAKRTFSKVDHRIFESLWYWATYRHPNKNPGWIAKRYWQQIGPRFWEFAVDAPHSRDGRQIKLRLARASAVTIRRHIKIRSDANPFDPSWRSYFEDRALLKQRGLQPRGGKE
jgi:RNA-directed DNA polymerase